MNNDDNPFSKINLIIDLLKKKSVEIGPVTITSSGEINLNISEENGYLVVAFGNPNLYVSFYGIRREVRRLSANKDNVKFDLGGIIKFEISIIKIMDALK